MVQSVDCLLCKHENLNMITSSHGKRAWHCNMHAPLIAMLGNQKDSWGLLASQNCLICEFQGH